MEFPKVVFCPSVGRKNLDESQIPMKRDLVRSIIADMFCLQEEMVRRYPSTKDMIQFKFCEVTFLESMDTVQVRVYAVDDPGQLLLSGEDAIFSYIWKLEGDNRLGWYPDDNEDELLFEIFKTVIRGWQMINNRNQGNLESWARGTRAKIAFGAEDDRTHAFNLMVGLVKVFYQNGWSVEI